VSVWLATAIFILGVGVIVARRRSIATALVAAQSLALGIGALRLAGGRSSAFLVASDVLLVKAIVLPLLLGWVIRHTREPRLVPSAGGPLMRLAMAGAVALAAVELFPRLGLTSAHTERAAVALALVGISIVVTRRPAFFQLLGLIVVENGLSLLAVAVPGGLSYVIELGALFDLTLVVGVAAAFTRRIHSDLGTGDTDRLRDLRD
jgi:hydrogenase-4 component E